MRTLAISASGLSFSFEDSPVLKGVSFQIPAGEFIGVIGPNGGGKTTLLKLLMGLLKPQGGSVLVFGKDPLAVRPRIGYVPQVSATDRAFPITVLELVKLGALTNSFSYPPETKEKALEILEELGLLPFASKAFSSLSGGLAQKALLARALISDPDLLLLDEPTANIDAKARGEIYEKLESLKGKKTILHVTHELQTIIEKVDRVLCVQTGAATYLPGNVCEHFALGLYHAPLLPKGRTDGIGPPL